MQEPAELAPSSEPIPARLAGLPRVGEPPSSDDSVRVASVPGRPGLPSPRAGGRPDDSRPLRARLADIEPELSFEAWLEAIRPGGTRPAQDGEAGESEDAESQAEAGEEGREEGGEHQYL